MARRTYTDADKALVYAALEANEGNVKRTARETNIPVATVRDWKHKAEREGLPAHIAEALPEAREALVNDLERVRNKALEALELRLDQIRGDHTALSKINPKDLATTTGILTDKVRVIEGKTTSAEQTSGGNLPIEQVRELFAGFAQGIIAGARDRDASISSAMGEEPIEGEATEQAELALPVSTS
jgi:transposase-like protein